MLTFDIAPEPNRQLGPIVRRVVENIAVAEQASDLWRTIGKHADSTNRAGFGDAFGPIQGALSDHFVLSIAKLYEKPSSRYEILSLPALANLIDSAATALVLENHRRVGAIIAPLPVPSPDEQTSELGNRSVSQFIRSLLPTLTPDNPRESASIIEAIKYRRDKVIAHSEHLGETPLPRLTWEQGEKLVEIAETIIGLMGWAYLRTAFTVDSGECLLTSDAQRGGRALTRLFSSASLPPNGDSVTV